MNTAQQRVLVVDDEPDIRELLDLTLTRMGLDVTTVEDLGEARRELGSSEFSFCLTDMRLPDGNGLDLVKEISELYPSLPTAVITAHGKVEDAVNALKMGAFDFVSKPVDLAILRKLVNTALKLMREAPDDLDEEDVERPPVPTGPLDKMVGKSRAMQQCKTMIAKLARSQAPVLVSGDSGSGKELAARLIHELGPRADGPFVPVNCGAIPTELMESEFFGHKKGSFTGATGDKEGLFQAADGGTLLLDEVADLPLHMQVKLLRAIQEKAVRPVGESREFPVDVRILSATHKDLGAMVSEGKFREDLFYRINVIEMRVPPLRERGEDIDGLVAHTVKRLGKQMPVDKLTVEAEALERLKRYAFPGNVRELENILERAATLSSDGVLRADDLLLRDESDESETTEARDLGETLVGVERDAIIQALEKTRYNKTAAAKLLGLSFRQLRYRIKKLGIE